VENFGKKMWKKIGVEKTLISVEKCQRGKKRDKFSWKNITYLVVCCCFRLVKQRKLPGHGFTAPFLVNTPGAQHMERHKIVHELQLNIFCRF
jgi:hypothetical protein